MRSSPWSDMRSVGWKKTSNSCLPALRDSSGLVSTVPAGWVLPPTSQGCFSSMKSRPSKYVWMRAVGGLSILIFLSPSSRYMSDS